MSGFSEQIARMVIEHGMGTREIYEALRAPGGGGPSYSYVGTVVSETRKRHGLPVMARGRPRASIVVGVAPDIRTTLEARAKARGVDVCILAERLLTAIVDDDLIDAVLDDGGEG